MTQSDVWKKRPVVLRYWEFKDECKKHGVIVPENGCHIIFTLPMPKSWSKKKKKEMDGKPHQQKKDVDNLLKALLDVVYKDDSGVWDVRITKRWGVKGQIVMSY